MAEQRQDDQLEPIYNSSVPILDIASKTLGERWTIETDGERGSGISVLAVQQDDDEKQSTIINSEKERGEKNIKIFHSNRQQTFYS